MNYYVLVRMPDTHYLLASTWDRKEDAINAVDEAKRMFPSVPSKDILVVSIVYA